MNIRAQRRELVDMFYQAAFLAESGEATAREYNAELLTKAKAFVEQYKNEPPSHRLASFSHMYNSLLASVGFYSNAAIATGQWDRDLMQSLLSVAIQQGENPYQKDWYPDDLSDIRARFIELSWCKNRGGLDTDALLQTACERYGVQWSTVQALLNVEDPMEDQRVMQLLQEPDTNLVPIPPGYQLTVANDFKNSVGLQSFYGEDLADLWNRAFYTTIQYTTTHVSYLISAAMTPEGKLKLSGQLEDGHIELEVGQLNRIANMLASELNRNAHELNLNIQYHAQLVRIGE